MKTLISTQTVIRRALLIFFALSAGACTENATEVVVVVNKYGITIGRDVDGLSLIVKTHANDTDPVFSLADHPLCPDGAAQPGCWSLPVTATLVPGPEDPDDPVVVQVLGLRAGQQVIGDQATFHFLSHVSQRLDFVLYGNCLNVDCTSSDAACDFNGDCEPITPTNFTGQPQLDGLPPGALPDLGGHDLYGRDLYASDLSGSDLMSRDLNMMSMMDMGLDMSMSQSADGSLPQQDGPSPAWVVKTSGTTRRLRAVWGSSGAGNLFAVGDGGLVLQSGDGGDTWNEERDGGSDLYSVWGTGDSGVVFAVGDAGTILQRQATGDWLPSINPWTSVPVTDLRGVWGDGPLDFFVVGGGQMFGQWNGSWSQICGTGDNTDSYHSVWGRSATDVWIAGVQPSTMPFVGHLSSMILCSQTGPDPSASGMPSPSDTPDLACACPIVPVAATLTQPEQSVSGSTMSEWVAGSAEDVRICGMNSCSGDGLTGAGQLNGVWAQSDGMVVVAVGAGGTIVRRVVAWAPESSGTMETLNGVWGLDGGAVWAVGDNGVILKRP